MPRRGLLFKLSVNLIQSANLYGSKVWINLAPTIYEERDSVFHIPTVLYLTLRCIGSKGKLF